MRSSHHFLDVERVQGLPTLKDYGLARRRGDPVSVRAVRGQLAPVVPGRCGSPRRCGTPYYNTVLYSKDALELLLRPSASTAVCSAPSAPVGTVKESENGTMARRDALHDRSDRLADGG